MLKKTKQCEIAKKRRKAAVYLSGDSGPKRNERIRIDKKYDIHRKHTDAIDEIYLAMPVMENIRNLKKEIKEIQRTMIRNEILGNKFN